MIHYFSSTVALESQAYNMLILIETFFLHDGITSVVRYNYGFY